MKILLLTDLHGKIETIARLEDTIRMADLLLLAGDITHFGRSGEIRKITDFISGYNRNIFAVTGNCDYPPAEQYLSEHEMSLTCRLKSRDGIYFTGLNGSLPCPGTTPQEYEEEEFRACLQGITDFIKHPFILVTHQPPFDTVCDRISSGEHVGSMAIRHFIEIHQPVLCLTGHIHEGIGTDSVGETQIVNPGPARSGKYAWLEMENGAIRELRIESI